MTALPIQSFVTEDILMLVLVDPKDGRAVRNKDSVLALYDLMINQKKSEEATAKFLRPDYIQHNPLIPDGSVGLGEYFGQVTRTRTRARVVVHRIIAFGDYVFAHVNFLNLLTDDPADTGIAGVDIYRFDSDGRGAEHWDTLQLVGNPTDSAPWVGPNISRANGQSMF
jgi:predicted SnoaL-like aldol condensation-catalyzing enzyme